MKQFLKMMFYQIPVEAPSQVSGRAEVLEVVHRDDVDDRADDTSRIFQDSF